MDEGKDVLFWLACIYVALYYIRPYEWVPGLVGTPIFFVTGILGIIALLFEWCIGEINLFKRQSDWFIFWFMIAIVLSHVSNGDLWAVIPSVLVFIPAFIGYFLVAHGIKNEKQYKQFVWFLIGVTVFLALEGIKQYHTGFAHGGMEPISAWTTSADGERTKDLLRIRWYGVFSDPNDLGLALVLPVPFLIDYIFRRKNIIALVIMIVVCYSLYLTNSRGAFLALIISSSVYCIFKLGLKKGLCFAGLLLAMAFVLGPGRMVDLSTEGESAYGRIDAWYAGFQMFKSSPLFGVGRGMFTELNELTAHNSFILILSELGVFGYFLFVSFLISTIIYPILEYKNNVGRHSALLACFTGTIFSSMFLSRSYLLLMYIIPALCTVKIHSTKIYKIKLSKSFGLSLCLVMVLFLIVKVSV